MDVCANFKICDITGWVFDHISYLQTSTPLMHTQYTVLCFDDTARALNCTLYKYKMLIFVLLSLPSGFS